MAALKAESGICIVCGEETRGIPAIPDIAIKAARSIRALFRMKPRHTLVCKEHMAEAAARRQKFEKERLAYFLAAIILFALVVAASASASQLTLQVFAAAILGALFIASLSLLSYFPAFPQKA